MQSSTRAGALPKLNLIDKYSTDVEVDQGLQFLLATDQRGPRQGFAAERSQALPTQGSAEESPREPSESRSLFCRSSRTTVLS